MGIFVRHGPIVRRCSGNGPEALSLRVEEAKKAKQLEDGGPFFRAASLPTPRIEGPLWPEGRRKARGRWGAPGQVHRATLEGAPQRAITDVPGQAAWQARLYDCLMVTQITVKTESTPRVCVESGRSGREPDTPIPDPDS